MDKLVENRNVAPFLRWTGSKRWFTKKHLMDFMPEKFGDYHEPFLGGAAVFFHLSNQESELREYFLSDFNEELINAYIQIRDDVHGVINQLKAFENTEKDCIYQ
ncbi:DNA adenine methylase [Pedobacter jejuensis]|uniref:DNA adenine methylase n=1 Tax=Pedobacter jejuensis TaxID=1268550 RepID=A0A3N0BV71_9SPHI|nr:DNA adenine methylase [Pedobacter jejuensis]RNL53007.1 hypothetical protein D7004_10615 [Pedobacter jejuensis]